MVVWCCTEWSCKLIKNHLGLLCTREDPNENKIYTSILYLFSRCISKIGYVYYAKYTKKYIPCINIASDDQLKKYYNNDKKTSIAYIHLVLSYQYL